MSATLSTEEIEAIVRGEHGDPFGVLGPHQVGAGAKTAVAVRAFLPDARQVVVVPSGQRDAGRPMNMVHPEGLYEAVFPQHRPPFPYRLRVTANQGQAYEIEDPYRFAPTLNDYDLYLMGEGTHFRN